MPGCFTKDTLGPAAAGFYRERGYLVVSDALGPDKVDELVGETVRICRGERGVFSPEGTRMDRPLRTDGMSDEEVQRQFLCIHHPHKMSAVMRRYLAEETVVKVLTSVVGPNVKCMQSMLFIKSAGEPGQAWHQDEDFIPTRDRSLVGAWIALDNATVENGCLWIIPGSHKPGILWPMHPHTDKRFDCTHESHRFPYGDNDAVPVEVPAGAVVFFNGYTLHRSLPNNAPGGFRRVLVNHYMSAESLLPWQMKGDTPVAQLDYRDIVMVAGEDPYAWKGREDLARAHVRPDGHGGCADGRELR